MTTPHSRAVVMAVAGFLVAAGVGLAGCGAGRGALSAADCTNAVRLDGRVYSGHGYTDRGTTKSAADVAECHDVGENVEGSVFPDDPRQVPVWTIHGYPPEQVLAVRRDENAYEVFVAESVPPADIEIIVEELSGTGR